MIIWHTSAFPSWYPKRVLRQVINKMRCFVQRRENQWRQRKQEGNPIPIISPRKQKPWNTQGGLQEDPLSNESDQLCQKANVEMDEWTEGCLYVLRFCLFMLWPSPWQGKGLLWPILLGRAQWQELGAAGHVELSLESGRNDCCHSTDFILLSV